MIDKYFVRSFEIIVKKKNFQKFVYEHETDHYNIGLIVQLFGETVKNYLIIYQTLFDTFSVIFFYVRNRNKKFNEFVNSWDKFHRTEIFGKFCDVIFFYCRNKNFFFCQIFLTLAILMFFSKISKWQSIIFSLYIVKNNYLSNKCFLV